MDIKRNTRAGMRSSLAAIGATVAAVLAFAVLAAPASALTWHHTTSFLHFPARQADAKSIRDRTIKLHGRYYWNSFTGYPGNEANGSHATRPPVKLHGRYYWSDYMQVWGTGYRHVSVLRNAKTFGRIRLVDYVNYKPRRSHRYHWGSTLNNVRDQSTHPS